MSWVITSRCEQTFLGRHGDWTPIEALAIPFTSKLAAERTGRAIAAGMYSILGIDPWSVVEIDDLHVDPVVFASVIEAWLALQPRCNACDRTATHEDGPHRLVLSCDDHARKQPRVWPARELLTAEAIRRAERWLARCHAEQREATAADCRRADGNVICEPCGGPYRLHPFTPDRDASTNDPFLHRLCDGSVVKL